MLNFTKNKCGKWSGFIIFIMANQCYADLPEKPVYTEEYHNLSKPYVKRNRSKNKISPLNKLDIKENKAGEIKRNTILQVGPGKEFSLPSIAANFAQDGDTVEIYSGGYYRGDEAVWKQNNIHIKGVSGRPHIEGYGKIKNGKAIWVIKGSNVTIENIEFSKAKVNHKNGAAIRNIGKHLKIVNCFVHDNENGILAGAGKDTIIEIKNSEFSFNGYGKGYTHNIYIGKIARFTITGSYVHHANVGHNIKSRANNNYILYNKILDGVNGRSSYSIDIPNGGKTYLIGNVIQQGRKTENSTVISYGAEGLKNIDKKIMLVNNTIVNDRHYGVFVKSVKESKVYIYNNIFYGKGKLGNIKFYEGINLITKDTKLFVNPENYDYRPLNSKLIIDKGRQVNNDSGFELVPQYEYVHPVKLVERMVDNRIDLGAFEY
ncbi:MAG: right-handed parallel beta-helix repeat-containing protein [Gammaproteobacteria bacterium]|nr:right-handed parallel beta-helix repeat-containing protein [Gammaproteobacteria bacterium]